MWRKPLVPVTSPHLPAMTHRKQAVPVLLQQRPAAMPEVSQPPHCSTGRKELQRNEACDVLIPIIYHVGTVKCNSHVAEHPNASFHGLRKYMAE